jgi:hypothetical protein
MMTHFPQKFASWNEHIVEENERPGGCGYALSLYTHRVYG